MTRTPLTRRPARTVPAVITALVVTALGLGLGWAGVSRLATQTWPSILIGPARDAADLTWSAPAMIIVAIGLAVLALVLIICALKPGAPTTVRLSLDSVPDTDLVIGRRSVARLSAALADLVDGVDRVSAIASRRTVRLAVRTPIDDDPGAIAEIRAAVSEQVTAGLASTGLAPLPTVSVTVRPS